MRKKEEFLEYVTFWNIGLVWLLHSDVLVGYACSADAPHISRARTPCSRAHPISRAHPDRVCVLMGCLNVDGVIFIFMFSSTEW